jgi:hypothetical protein
MEYLALPILPVGKRRLQGGNGRINGLHVFAEGPADDLPVIEVFFPPSDISSLPGYADR